MVTIQSLNSPDELHHRIALTLVSGVGPVLAKSLMAHCGSAQMVFGEKRRLLERIPGVGSTTAKNIQDKSPLERAAAELRFIEDKGIQVLYFKDETYPRRLRYCEDGPLLLYYRGTAELNKHQVVAVVGTRSATDYGKRFCQRFMEELRQFNPLIISGLAYGIDSVAHKEALRAGLPTVGVLGHGLDRIYPASNRALAIKMLERGGLLTEFLSETNPDRENFPKRNRIVAGISDAVVVVEAAITGGALITARIANSYNRDVFAVPGRLNDRFSAGCNYLIRTNQAALVQSVEDLKYLLGWEEEKSPSNGQQQLLLEELPAVEKFLMNTLSENGGKLELHQICSLSGKNVSETLQHLMSLELKGMVRSLPGRVYSL